MNTAIAVFAFVVLTLLREPIFAAVGLTMLITLFLIEIPLTPVAQTAITSLQPFPLLTIPFSSWRAAWWSRAAWPPR
jgi:hypothetical protein